MRAAACALSHRINTGHVDLEEADSAAELLTDVRDPLIETGFQSGYSYALALCARYEDALSVAEALLAATQRYRLDFARPYALHAAAMAHSGLRRWEEATRCLNEAEFSAPTARARSVA